MYDRLWNEGALSNEEGPHPAGERKNQKERESWNIMQTRQGFRKAILTNHQGEILRLVAERKSGIPRRGKVLGG